MRSFLRQVWKDIINGENIDLYLTILLSIIVGSLSLLGIVHLNLILSLTLTVLAMLAFSTLHNRNQIERFVKLSQESPISFHSESPVTLERLKNSYSIFHNGITLIGSSNLWVQTFKDCLESNKSVQLVMINPYNEAAIEVASQRFYKHQDPELLKKESELAIENFKPLLNIDSSESPLKFFNAMQPFSLWILDRKEPNAEMWVGFYPYRADKEPWIHIYKKENKELFKYFCKQADLIWETSEYLCKTKNTN